MKRPERPPADPPRGPLFRYVFFGRRLPDRHAAWVHHDVISTRWRTRQLLATCALAVGVGAVITLLLALYLGGISSEARIVLAAAIAAPVIVFFGRSERDAARVLTRHHLRMDGRWEPHPPRVSRTFRTFTTTLGIALLAGAVGYTIVNRDLLEPTKIEGGCKEVGGDVQDGIVRFTAEEVGPLRGVRTGDRTLVAAVVGAEVAEWWVLHDFGDEVQALNEPAKRVTPHFALTPVDEASIAFYAEQRVLAGSCATAAGLPEGVDR